LTDLVSEIRERTSLANKREETLNRDEFLEYQTNIKKLAPFDNRSFGYTPVTKSSGTRIATDFVIGRVVE